MFWYWKVRLYFRGKGYTHVEVKTNRTLGEIDTIQDFYKDLTGERMLLEGMSETTFGYPPLADQFYKLTQGKDIQS